jgi:hypothetical protein
MLVHRIILTKKPKQNTMKNIIQTIKKQVILFTFCINILLCFASCAYFGAADSKMREVRQIQQDAKQVLDTPDLFSDMKIEDLQKAVDQDIKDMKKKLKNK